MVPAVFALSLNNGAVGEEVQHLCTSPSALGNTERDSSLVKYVI